MAKSKYTRTVRTQEDLDEALTDGVREILIKSPAGVWMEISSSDSASVYASDSASVHASGSASVHAYGSASVHASDSASVYASGSASVHASDSASVYAYGSASVHASGSASVYASGSASVHASGAASVHASGSASVYASGSASVYAYGSASVYAYGSASVYAYGSASVYAGKFTAVRLHSKRATIDSEGHVIDITDLNLGDAATWFEYHGVEVVDGIAFVYKAVRADWTSPYGASYEPGSTPEALDWDTRPECGGGLHFSARPDLALQYLPDAARLLKAGVRVDETVVLYDKIKARRVVAACVEVDLNGNPLAG